MITLVPGGGLANRMRAIDSAYQLSQKQNQELLVIWIKNSELNCSFNDIFEDTPFFKVKKFSPFNFYAYPNHLQKKSIFIKQIVKWQRHKMFDSILLNEEIHKNLYIDKKEIIIENNYSNLFIDTCERFIEGSNLFKLFKPQKKIRNKIEDILREFNDNTIGLHIRRTDNVSAIKSSPIDFFIKEMANELKLQKHTKFFLSTDDKTIKTKLVNSYQNLIITRNIKYSRKSKQGIIDALIDFILLSKTKKIIGSDFSSFSLEAAHIGKIELITPRSEKNRILF